MSGSKQNSELQAFIDATQGLDRDVVRLRSALTDLNEALKTPPRSLDRSFKSSMEGLATSSKELTELMTEIVTGTLGMFATTGMMPDELRYGATDLSTQFVLLSDSFHKRLAPPPSIQEKRLFQVVNTAAELASRVVKGADHVSYALKESGIESVDFCKPMRCMAVQTNALDGPKVMLVDISNRDQDEHLTLQFKGPGLQNRELRSYLSLRLIGVDLIPENGWENIAQARAESIFPILADLADSFSDAVFSTLTSTRLSASPIGDVDLESDTVSDVYYLCVPHKDHLSTRTRQAGLKDGFPLYFAMGESTSIRSQSFAGEDARALLRDEYRLRPNQTQPKDTYTFEKCRGTLIRELQKMSEAASLAASGTFEITPQLSSRFSNLSVDSRVGTGPDCSSPASSTPPQASPSVATPSQSDAKARKTARRAAGRRRARRERQLVAANESDSVGGSVRTTT